jgi:hypothetical protein
MGLASHYTEGSFKMTSLFYYGCKVLWKKNLQRASVEEPVLGVLLLFLRPNSSHPLCSLFGHIVKI